MKILIKYRPNLLLLLYFVAVWNPVFALCGGKDTIHNKELLPFSNFIKTEKVNISFSNPDNTVNDLSINPEIIHHGDIVTPDPIIPLSVGLFAGNSYNKFDGGLGIFEHGQSCISFKDGDGLNISGGVFAEACFYPEFSIQIRALFDNKSGVMKTDYFLPILNDRTAKTEHELKITLLYLSFDLIFKFNLSENTYIFSGASLGMPITYKYEHRVKIISEEISYENGITEKLISSKKIDDINLKVGIKAGFGFNIPVILDRIYLSPEISGEYLLQDIIKGNEFKAINLTGSLMFRFDL